MADNLDAIKRKIAALLSKADNTAVTVEEAKAFNAKAYELMEKYNLERAAVEAAAPGKKVESARTHKTLQVLKRPWSSAILHGICDLYFCKWIFTRNGRTDTITIIGEESNVAVCHAVAVMVLRAVQTEARTTAGGRSFMTGASQTIYQRCKDMRPQNQLASTTGTALMVIGNNEQALNIDYAQKLFGGNIRQAAPSKARINSSGAFAAGQSFGRTVPITGNLIR